MKFTKLTKKLLLSALSLGLAVVTLTTTTFAWYTTSTEASATGSGSTSGSTDDSTLLISNDYDTKGAAATWSKTTSFANATALMPAQLVGGAFKNLKGEAESGVYTFTLWFKTSRTTGSSDIGVYLSKLNIVNDGGITPYDNLLNGVTGLTDTLVPTGANYTIDAVRALDMKIGNTAYELSNQFEYEEDSVTSKETIDAEYYYNSVMGGTLTDNSDELTPLYVGDGNVVTTAADGNNHVSIGEITYVAADGETPAHYDVLEVTFTIFLNGWDQYCFDACKGQDFNIELEFTTKPAKNA